MAPRVLLAEDHDSFAASLEALLRRRGLEVERAGDGVEALSRIAAAPPDLLLLDLKLPRLHGIEVLKKIRQSERTRQLPVIIVTGVFRGERYAQAARALGVETYLEKPFSASVLVAALEKHLPPSPAPPPRGGMELHLAKALTSGLCGHLSLKRDGTEHRLVFSQGLPIHLEPGFSCRDFGDWLRRRGVISAEEYSWYHGPGQGRPQVLVELGCLPYPELLRERLSYLGAELIEAFALPPMTAEQHPVPCPAGIEPLAINVPDIIYQGLHRQGAPGPGRRLLEQFGPRYLGPGEAYYRLINFLTLSAEEKAALERLDGSRTLSGWLEGREELLPLLLTLRSLEMVRFAEAPFVQPAPAGMPLRVLFNALVEDVEELVEETLESFGDLVEPGAEEDVVPDALQAPLGQLAGGGASPLAQKIRQTRAELEGKDYYQIFGMTQGKFSFDQLKERYFAFTREYGPDLLMQLSGEESTVVEEILATVANAYSTLSDVVKKERYDELLGSEKIGLGREGDDQFQAQVQFQSGKVFLDMGEWDSAEKALQDACTIAPGNGEYLAHLAWAIYRNPVNASSRAMQEKARQLLNRALGLERSAAGFAFKGWMLLEAGQDALAEGEFNKSLKLDARHMLARKGLREIQEKREQQKKGLFGRMFR